MWLWVLYFRITGTLPEEIIEDLEGRGIKVHSREMDDWRKPAKEEVQYSRGLEERGFLRFCFVFFVVMLYYVLSTPKSLGFNQSSRERK